MKNIVFSLVQCVFILSLSFMISCGSSDDLVDQTECDEVGINALSEQFVEVTTTYIQDPTTANCEAYKTGAEAYLKALNECAELYSTEIETTQNAIDQIQC